MSRSRCAYIGTYIHLCITNLGASILGPVPDFVLLEMQQVLDQEEYPLSWSDQTSSLGTKGGLPTLSVPESGSHTQETSS